MAHIVTLGGIKLPDGKKPDPEVLLAAEEILKLVQTGEVCGLTAVVQKLDGITHTYATGPFDIEPMLGHLHRQMHRLTLEAERQDKGG